MGSKTFYPYEFLYKYHMVKKCPVCKCPITVPRYYEHGKYWIKSSMVYFNKEQDFAFLVHIKCKPKLTPDMIQKEFERVLTYERFYTKENQGISSQG